MIQRCHPMLSMSDHDDGELIHGAVQTLSTAKGCETQRLDFDSIKLISFVDFLAATYPSPANEILAMSATLPTALSSGSSMRDWIPIALLMLAVISSVSFIRLWRTRPATPAAERLGDHEDASMSVTANDLSAACHS